MTSPPHHLGQAPPHVRLPLPGPTAAALVDQLARTECPALTARRARRAEVSGARHDPIIWSEASGANVVDADGNVFVDLTSGFGAAAIGHGHPRVVAAVQAQAARLCHALGDVHPADVKVELLVRLARMAPFADARVILGLSGSDAVAAALKTAQLHSKRPGVLAFRGSYHGLAYGPLSVCGYNERFRQPFSDQLNPHVSFAPYPTADLSNVDAIGAVELAWPAGNDIGAVLIEPMLGRGGVIMPPPGFLAALGELCRKRRALLIVDEILTGLGRCGATLLSVEQGVEPDVICLGKALGGGLPISACIGRPEVMAAWGASDGEALHTGTFFGHPISCAAALAALAALEEERLGARALSVGDAFAARLRDVAGRQKSLGRVRGRGMLLGVEVRGGSGTTLAIVRGLLERGFLTLPAGPSADVVQFLPPLTTSEQLLELFAENLEAVAAEVASTRQETDPGERPREPTE